MKLKIACIQINTGSDVAANIACVETLIVQAAGQGAELVALPENVFLMRDSAQKGDFEKYTQDNHPGVLAMQRLAKQQKIWILVGSIHCHASEGWHPRQSNAQAINVDCSAPFGSGLRRDDKLFNRSILINSEGDIAASYDKIHLFDVTLPNGEVYAESARFEAGEKMVVADTPAGRLGMTICYDVRFPHLYRQLAKAGAQILAVPAAFTQTTGEAHWEVLLRSRAIENGCYVIAPAQTGTHPGGRKTFGHALIIDPWGKVLADAGEGEGVIVADIDLAEVARVRASLPSLQHDRGFS